MKLSVSGSQNTCALHINEEDSHFNILKSIPFPRVEMKKLQDFYDELVSGKDD